MRVQEFGIEIMRTNAVIILYAHMTFKFIILNIFSKLSSIDSIDSQFIFIKNRSMNPSAAGQDNSKSFNNLTALAFMNSTSRYVKSGPVPQGTYESQKPLPKVQRYGSNRRVLKKQTAQNSSNYSQPLQLKDSASETNQKISQATNQNKQQQTPKSKIRKSIGSNVISSRNLQQTLQSPKVEEQVERKVVNVARSTNSNVSNLNQTPQSIRYGSNRRVQAQKTDQIISKYEQPIKLVTQIQQPILLPPKQKQKVVIINKIITANNNRFTSPIAKLTNQFTEDSNIAHKTPNARPGQTQAYSESEKVSSPNQWSEVKIAQPVSKGSRVNRARDSKVELRGSQVTQKQGNKEQALNSKRSNLIVFVIRSTFFNKISAHFWDLKQHCARMKSKQIRKTKLFLAKLCFIQKVLNQYVQTYSFKKIFKPAASISTQQIKHKNSNVKTENFQNTKLNCINNCRKYLVIALHSIFQSKIKNYYRNLRLYKAKVNKNNVTNVCHMLEKIFIRRVCLVWERIARFSSIVYSLKVKSLKTLVAIAKNHRIEIKRLVFKKFLLISRHSTIQVKGSQKSSPIHTFKKDRSSSSLFSGSPTKTQIDPIISKLQKKLQKSQSTLSKLKQNSTAISSQFQNQKLILQNSCLELSQQISQKTKFQTQLKVQLESLSYVVEDYIQNSDLLQTKFPFLFQLHLKIQKNPSVSLSISSLTSSYPQLSNIQEESVENWIFWLKNQQLKRIIARYEGENQLEIEIRSGKQDGNVQGTGGDRGNGMRMARMEEKCLKEMVRGYVQERYAWEWVRGSVSGM